MTALALTLGYEAPQSPKRICRSRVRMIGYGAGLALHGGVIAFAFFLSAGKPADLPPAEPLPPLLLQEFSVPTPTVQPRREPPHLRPAPKPVKVKVVQPVVKAASDPIAPSKDRELEPSQKDVATPVAAAVVPVPVTSGSEKLPQHGAAKGVDSWQARVAAYLESRKHYPQSARDRSQQGNIVARLTINRMGEVQSVELLVPCAVRVLNDEALAMIARASPLPPPQEMEGDPLELTVPIRFSLH